MEDFEDNFETTEKDFSFYCLPGLIHLRMSKTGHYIFYKNKYDKSSKWKDAHSPLQAMFGVFFISENKSHWKFGVEAFTFTILLKK